MSKFKFLAIFIFFCGFTFDLFAQVDTAWVRRYNGPGNGSDGASAGGALQFDGTNDEVDIPHDASLSFGASDPMTVELWFKLSEPRDTYHLIGKRPNCYDLNYQIAVSGNAIAFSSSGNGAGQVYTSFASTINQWVHVAGSYDGSMFRLYINGEFKAEQAGVMLNENTAPLRIGQSGTCINEQRFIGQIDEVRVWNVARQGLDINANYNHTIDPGTPGLVGYWNFDEDIADQSVIDRSLHGNNGTLGASAASGPDDPARVVSTAPLGGDTPPRPTIDTVLDAGTGDKIFLKWHQQDKTGVTAYEVSYGLSPGNFVFTRTIPETGNVYDTVIFSGLTTHTPYYIAVRAYDSTSGNFSTYATFGPVYPTIPVVLVHGICPGGPHIWDDPNSTEDYKQWLEVANFNHLWIVDNLECCGWYGEEHYDSNAVRLSRFIEAKAVALQSQTQIPIDSLDIIAHSMGGLISRRYISDPDLSLAVGSTPHPVKRLIMLGTPNLGTNLGDKAKDCGIFSSAILCAGPAKSELGMENMIEFNNRYFRRRGARYYVAWGSGRRLGEGCDSTVQGQSCSWKLELARKFELCPNDGVVWKFSAEIALLDGVREGLWCHDEYYIDSTLFASFVKPILLGQLVAQEISVATSKVENYGSTPQIAITRCGAIEPSQQQSEPITVEIGGMSIMLLATDPNLGLTLESPSGIIWDSIRAESDPTVLYSSSLDGKGFVFDNAEPGTWIVHYNAQNVNSSSTQGASTTINYSLLVAFQNPVNLQATISETYPLPGDSIILTVTLTDNSVPIIGATITVLPIHENTDTLTQFILLDDGNHSDGAADDGVYAAVFNQTADSGLVTFDLVATGIASSVDSFRREASLAAYIYQPCTAKAGDASSDNTVNLADIIFLVNAVFKGGPKPSPLCRGDVNASGGNPNLTDIIYLVNGFFKGGPAPVKSGACCL